MCQQTSFCGEEGLLYEEVVPQMTCAVDVQKSALTPWLSDPDR